MGRLSHFPCKDYNNYRTNKNAFNQSFNLCLLLLCPAGKIVEKAGVEECIFDYMASHIECRFNKNSLLQCYFLAILPAGYLLFICRQR